MSNIRGQKGCVFAEKSQNAAVYAIAAAYAAYALQRPVPHTHCSVLCRIRIAAAYAVSSCTISLLLRAFHLPSLNNSPIPKPE